MSRNSCGNVRIGSPPGGSIFRPCAPRSASIWVACGTGRQMPASRTRIPSSSAVTSRARGVVAQLPAQYELLDLPARGPWEFLDRPQVLGPLLARDTGLLEIRPHLGEVGRGASGVHAEERARDLAEPGVGCGDDRDLGN